MLMKMEIIPFKESASKTLESTTGCGNLRFLVIRVSSSFCKNLGTVESILCPNKVIDSIRESSELQFLVDVESILWWISTAVQLSADVYEGEGNKSIGKLNIEQTYNNNRNKE